MKTKETIRKTMLAKRGHFTQEEIADKDQSLLKHLMECDELLEVRDLLTYASRPGEAKTLSYIDYMLQHIDSVWVPRTLPDNTLKWISIDTVAELKPGAFGIPEPDSDDEGINMQPPDAPVIVPMLAFSNSGHRIGYGGGYFDRFLKDHRGLKVGLAYEWQHIDVMPVESHDIPLDIIITETSIRYMD
jgi:5-formyltetrahydrofolate cyclo-ligase